jgi:Uma2 family endonuclease
MTTALKIGPADSGRRMTWDEFATAGFEEGFRYELIEGRLTVSPSPNPPQDRLVRWLDVRLQLYTMMNPTVVNYTTQGAGVFIPGASARLTVPQPDLAAYASYPLNLPMAQVSWQDVSPFLVVEILSEDDPDKDLVRNVDLYLRAPSIREYWIVEPRPVPDEPTLLVYRRRGQRWQNVITVPYGETYTTKLLPGFSLVVDPRR